mgnify:CR=1 FL=1
MDAIVASGRPGAVATTGPDGVIGKTYGEIIQDMVDWYAMAQSDSATQGGWRYNAWNNSFGSHDNSTSGWAGTGIVAVDPKYYRPTEVETLLGDPSKAKEELGWTPKISFEAMVEEMMETDLELAKRDDLVEREGFKAFKYYE